MTHKAYEIAVWITNLAPNTAAITEQLQPFFRLLEEAQYWLPQSEPGPRQALASRIGSELAPRDSGKELSVEDRAHAYDVAERYERGEFHCKCGKPITAEHPRCP